MLMICENAKICRSVGTCKNSSPHKRDGFCSYNCSLVPSAKDSEHKCVPYKEPRRPTPEEGVFIKAGLLKAKDVYYGSITIAVQTGPDSSKVLQPFKLGNTLVEELGIYKEEGITVWVIRDGPKKEVIKQDVCASCHLTQCVCRDPLSELEEISKLDVESGYDQFGRKVTDIDKVLVNKVNEIIRRIGKEQIKDCPEKEERISLLETALYEIKREWSILLEKASKKDIKSFGDVSPLTGCIAIWLDKVKI